MITDKMINEFFEEQFNNTSQIFLFKDKQLLKENDYEGFAENQLKKAKSTFWGMIGFLGLFLLWGFHYVLVFGGSSEWLDLVLALSCIICSGGMLFYGAKEYYTIQSSMKLLLKLLDEEKKKQ